MPTSDDDLQKQQAAVEKLREQVKAEEEKRLVRQRESANDVAYTELQAEEARLRARLAEAKNAGKVASVKEGLDAPLSAAKEDLVRAVAQQKAAENPPDDQGQVPTSVPDPVTDETTKGEGN